MGSSVQSVLLLDQGRHVFVGFGLWRHISVGAVIHFGWRHVRETEVHLVLTNTRARRKNNSRRKCFDFTAFVFSAYTHTTDRRSRSTVSNYVTKRFTSEFTMSSGTWKDAWYVIVAKRDKQPKNNKLCLRITNYERVWLTGKRALKMADNTINRESVNMYVVRTTLPW